jgi:Domain of unknown function (DUF4160)
MWPYGPALTQYHLDVPRAAIWLDGLKISVNGTLLLWAHVQVRTPESTDKGSIRNREVEGMGFLDFLSGAKDVACVTISFAAGPDHRIRIERQLAAPSWLDGPILDTALFLHYAVNGLYALGSAMDREALRQRITIPALVTGLDTFKPFTKWVTNQPGQCIGWLKMGTSGNLWMLTRFKVPLRLTNLCVEDSVLMMYDHAVASQPTAEHRRRLEDAIRALEQHYQTVVIAIYFKDHGPPHFHAKYGSQRASFSINDLRLIEGKLPPRVVSLILEWAFQHREELLENWTRAERKEDLHKIEPLV